MLSLSDKYGRTKKQERENECGVYNLLQKVQLIVQLDTASFND